MRATYTGGAMQAQRKLDQRETEHDSKLTQLEKIELCVNSANPQGNLLDLLDLKDISETENYIKRIAVFDSNMEKTDCGYFSEIYNIGLILLALKSYWLDIGLSVKSEFGITEQHRDIIKQYLGDLYCKKLEQSDAPYAKVVKKILTSPRTSLSI